MTVSLLGPQVEVDETPITMEYLEQLPVAPTVPEEEEGFEPSFEPAPEAPQA